MRCIGIAAHAADAGGLFGECCGPADRELLAVDGGDTFTVAVDAAGRAVGWGSAFYGELGADNHDQPSVQLPPTDLDVPVPCVSVACGRNHVLTLSAAGAMIHQQSRVACQQLTML